MEELWNLFAGDSGEWSGDIAHSVLVLSLVIAAGIALGKIRIRGVSPGAVWILFAGMLAGYLGMGMEEQLLTFLREFGLILFVYAVGIQVGPGFFSAFKKGGE